MTLFFDTSAPGFKSKWEAVRARGFFWFYARSAWRWAIFVLVIQTGGFLARGRSSAWGDVGAAALAAVLFGAAMPPIQWKLYERKYRSRVYGHKK